jgi:hypothetical protein
MPFFKFRMGDLFDADDPLAVWVCTLSVAFNDAIHAAVKFSAADRSWESMYEWRVGVSHLSEACLHLERGREIDQVTQFIRKEGLLASFEDVLDRYDALRKVANRIRSEATFHYPYEKGEKAVTRAMRELADAEEVIGSDGPSTKIRHSRQLYADDVVAMLVLNACGGTAEAHAETSAKLGEAVAAFGRFSNATLDAYFVRHAKALSPVGERDPRL